MGTLRRSLFRSWFSVGALALGGSALLACSDAAERRPDEPQQLLHGWGGMPPSVAVLLDGGDAGQREDCQKALAELGVSNAPAPAVAVLVDVSRENKILHLMSRTRGAVRHESRPAWPVRALCRDALALSLRELLSEQTSAVGGYAAQQPGQPAPVVLYAPNSVPMPPYYAPNTVPMPPAAFSGGRPDDPASVLSGWSGPPPEVSVVLGSRASPRQQERCAETIRKYGITPSPTASFVAAIETETSRSREEEANVLSVLTPRGLAVYGYRPGWGVDELCKDGLAQVLRAYLAELTGVRAYAAPPRL